MSGTNAFSKPPQYYGQEVNKNEEREEGEADGEFEYDEPYPDPANYQLASSSSSTQAPAPAYRQIRPHHPTVSPKDSGLTDETLAALSREEFPAQWSLYGDKTMKLVTRLDECCEDLGIPSEQARQRIRKRLEKWNWYGLPPDAHEHLTVN